MSINDSGFLDATIIFAIFGFLIGMIIGDIFQTLILQVIYPEVTQGITEAVCVTGTWKESQENIISAGRIAIDMLFGVGGAISFFALFTLIGGKE